MNSKPAGWRHRQGLFLLSSVLVSGGFLSACNNPPANDEQLQQQAAKATEDAKRQSAEALAQAQVAAANAAKALDDVAAGVKEGLDQKNPEGRGRVDLNHASEADLSALPGISNAKAAQIMRHRPYASSHDLVKSGILSEHQYEDIAGKVTAGK